MRRERDEFYRGHRLNCGLNSEGHEDDSALVMRGRPRDRYIKVDGTVFILFVNCLFGQYVSKSSFDNAAGTFSTITQVIHFI